LLFLSVVLCLSALTFFLLRQKESNKEKGDFFWIAPRKKRATRCLRKAMVSGMALVFCRGSRDIALVLPVWLVVGNQAFMGQWRQNEGTIKG